METPAGADPKLVGSVSSLALNATIEDSAIGALSPIPLDIFSNLFAGEITTLLNDILGKGFDINLGDLVSLVQPRVFEEDGFITIATDFAFAS